MSILIVRFKSRFVSNDIFMCLFYYPILIIRQMKTYKKLYLLNNRFIYNINNQV